MSQNRHNLTLLELVICLGIVVALSTILLDNFAIVKLQESSNVTTQRGYMVKEVMNGQNRFASDMGRFPVVYKDNDNNENRYLAYLYDPSILYHNSDTDTMFKHTESLTIDNDILGFNESPTFTQYVFPTVNMQVGWDGPYISVSKNIGGDFVDGFGRPWAVVTDYHLKNEGTNRVESYNIVESPSDKVEIDGIFSYGADNAEGGEGADEDQIFIFSENQNQARLIITLKVKDDFNPAIWNEPTLSTPEIYTIGTTYSKGDVVNYNNSFYTCTGDAVSTTPSSGLGWRWGTPSNYFDTAKVVLFTPAKGGTDTAPMMTLGWFEFTPQVSSDALYSQCHLGGGNYDIDESITTSDGKNMLRMYPKYNWNYDSNSSPSATFMISGLVAGRRQLYSFVAMEAGSSAEVGTYKLSNFAASPLEYIDLKAGDNYITLYLERKK